MRILRSVALVFILAGCSGPPINLGSQDGGSAAPAHLTYSTNPAVCTLTARNAAGETSAGVAR